MRNEVLAAAAYRRKTARSKVRIYHRARQVDQPTIADAEAVLELLA